MDPRVQKLAEVLVGYSLDLQPGDTLAVKTNPFADELNLAVYQEALMAGAHPYFLYQVPGMWEVLLKHASDAQLEYISEIDRVVVEGYRAILHIEAEYNTRELTGTDPARLSRRQKARSGVFKIQTDRMGSGELHWCYTVYPTQSSAQEADLGFLEYQDFVFKAGKLDLADPVGAWKVEDQHLQRVVSHLDGTRAVKIQGKDVDLSLSLEDRTFEPCSGKLNFPDGEIYTSPVEESVEGWVRFAYPAIYGGREVVDVELWFEDGKIVKEKASKGAEFLTPILNTDQGSRYLGELGIGTNYDIPRFTKNILFDEKLGGTIHLAVGLGFPALGGKNTSGVHWDMLCDMSDGEMTFDDALVYRGGKFIIGD